MRNKSAVLAALVTAACTVAGTATAQEWGPKAGDTEFTLAGTGSNDKDFDNGSFGLSISAGKYLTDTWQWSIRQGVTFAEVADDESLNGSTRLAVDYNFRPGERLRPFLGVNVGMIYGDSVEETGIAGPELGLKYYVKPQTFVYLQTEYQFFFDDAGDVDDQFNDGSWAHTVGFGVNF